MIQINATDLSGFFAIYNAIAGIGPGTQASVVVDTETSLILAVTPQGQLVVTPVKTISVAAPEAPLAWQPEVVVAPEPPTDAPAPDAPASDAPAAEPATEAPTGDATAPTGDPATT